MMIVGSGAVTMSSQRQLQVQKAIAIGFASAIVVALVWLTMTYALRSPTPIPVVHRAISDATSQDVPPALQEWEARWEKSEHQVNGSVVSPLGDELREILAKLDKPLAPEVLIELMDRADALRDPYVRKTCCIAAIQQLRDDPAELAQKRDRLRSLAPAYQRAALHLYVGADGKETVMAANVMLDVFPDTPPMSRGDWALVGAVGYYHEQQHERAWAELQAIPDAPSQGQGGVAYFAADSSLPYWKGHIALTTGRYAEAVSYLKTVAYSPSRHAQEACRDLVPAAARAQMRQEAEEALAQLVGSYPISDFEVDVLRDEIAGNR
jgi:hypothetical protein